MATETGQVSSWVLKLILGVAIVGFLLIEFGSVVITRLQAGDVAGQTAQEAGFTYDRGNLEAAEARAEAYAEENDAEFVDLELRREDEEICVTVRKTASTIVIHRIGFLEDLTESEASECAPLR